MFTPTHGIMHHNITMTLRHWFIAACMCCLLVMGTATAASIDDAIAANRKGDYAQAIKIFGSLAAQGNADAQFALGAMYQHGQGVPQNYQEAVKWYRLAATQGDVLAQAYLGSLYYTGKGVIQDYHEAMKWYRLAAAQGDVDAQIILGSIYANGQGIAQNYREAVKWYRLAAEQGHAGAQTNLGAMYAEGKGVTQDYQEAMKWYRLAGAQGDEFAKKVLRRPEMVAAAQNLATMQEQPQLSASSRTQTKAGWVYIGSNDGFTDYADPTTIHRVGNKVIMWVLTDFKPARQFAGEQYMSQMIQKEYDCKERQSRQLYISIHSENMGGGEVLTADAVNGDWRPVRFGTAGGVMLEFACRE